MFGAFAERGRRPAALAPIPDGVDAARGGVRCRHRTAYRLLRSMAHVTAGDELIVLVAGGGVGLAAVQVGGRSGRTSPR